jgi:hypothetical protein
MVDGNMDDAAWTDRVLRELPSVPSTAALESRVLADFDATASRRQRSWLARFADAVWPGAPVWQPAAALGLSLAVGIAVGVVYPLEDMLADNAEPQTVATTALEEPPAFFDAGENS